MSVKNVTEYIEKLKGPRAKIVDVLRKILKKVAPDSTESFKWAQPVYDDHGPFCYISAHSDHVELGFWRGSELQDPKGLLSGEGEKMRGLKIYSIKQIKEIEPKSIAQLIRQAIKLNREKGNPVC